MSSTDLKEEVRKFWQRASCGETYAHGVALQERLAEQSRVRYELEPYIEAFARFEEAAGLDLLEVGVGMGADHLRWADAMPHVLIGIDLTSRAIEFTRARLTLAERPPRLALADAEKLPFRDASFDLVYSWGVLHHTPDTARAIGEVHRVLRPGGRARVMIYHRRSIVGAVLWVRYGLLCGVPFRGLDALYSEHLESPGTKAYSVAEARALFGEFAEVYVRPLVSFADLLRGEVGQQHRGVALAVARAIWPRMLIRQLGKQFGLYLLIDARK